MSASARDSPARATAFAVPLRTVSLLNSREHWSARARRAAKERGTVRVAAQAWGLGSFELPCVVRLVRCAPRRLDDDNLRGSLKHVRDGVADALGVDDGDPRVEWQYAQEKSAPKAYAVRVEVEEVRS
jgi:hypothetical protein